MKLRVHILHELDPEFVPKLQRRLAPDIGLSRGAMLPTPARYHVLVAGRLEKHHLTASPLLHTVIIPWAGLPMATRELLLEFPHLAVHNLHHNALPSAELAFTLMLTTAKKIVPTDRALRLGDWTPRYSPNSMLVLRGKTVLILGYGAIGRKIATMCEGFGMRVIAVRREDESASVNPVELRTVSHLPALLPRANVIFVSLPFTPETEGMLGPTELSLLPDDAILVNIARGPIVDEAALYEELKSGRIRAGLDVWYNYPQSESDRTDIAPAHHAFHELDNVVMTPHLAGHSADMESLRAEGLAELLNLAATGEPLPNAVDPKRGY